MGIKEYSTFLNAPEMEPQHQIQVSIQGNREKTYSTVPAD